MNEPTPAGARSADILLTAAPPATQAAAWLRLAATPTFGVMALVTGLGEHADPMCSAAHAAPLGGMAAMYLLMSAFHAAPWLGLIDARGREATRPRHSAGHDNER